MLSAKELIYMHKMGLDTLPEDAWYTKSGIRAAKAGANDALKQSK